MDTSPLIHCRELSVATPRGHLHVAHWSQPHERSGGSAPIVLFHDSLGCVALWRDFPLHLASATGRDVIAYDRLGFGRSDPHPGTLDIGFVEGEAHAGFRHLCEALSLDRFVAFGHSVGGGMAIGCAAAYPMQCRGLISESAQAYVEERTLQGIRAARTAFAHPDQMARLRKYHGSKAAWVLPAWIDSWLAPAFANWTLDDTLRRVTCPVLAIHGDGDEYGSCRQPERIVDLVRSPATLKIMTGIGHVPHRERGDEVLALVRHWLADINA